MKLELLGIDQLAQLETFWRIWWPDRALLLLVEALAENAKLTLDGDTSGPDGQPWDPWSTEYAKSRGPGHKLLRSEGTLAESLTGQVQAGDYVVGSELDYALVHQYGSKDGTTPDRPYAGVSDEIELAMADIFMADFDGGWAAVRA